MPRFAWTRRGLLVLTRADLSGVTFRLIGYEVFAIAALALTALALVWQ